MSDIVSYKVRGLIWAVSNNTRLTSCNISTTRHDLTLLVTFHCRHARKPASITKNRPKWVVTFLIDTRPSERGNSTLYLFDMWYVHCTLITTNFIYLIITTITTVESHSPAELAKMRKRSLRILSTQPSKQNEGSSVQIVQNSLWMCSQQIFLLKELSIFGMACLQQSTFHLYPALRALSVVLTFQNL